MTVPRLLGLLILAAMMPGCNPERSAGDGGEAGSDPDAATGKTLGAQVVLPTEDYLKLPEYRDADPDYGARLLMQCRACHSFQPGGPSISGPNLHGVFGRAAGKLDGFPYSRALAEAEFIWTPEALDAWLEQPTRFLPGNRMIYPGMPDQEDRNALIAQLLRITDDSGTVSDRE